MRKVALKDDSESFDVTVLEATKPSRVVLFAVGGGGNPERHLPLLSRFCEGGCTVIAPHFERLLAPRPTEQELLMRARRLKLALESLAPAGLPAVGVGHSIGTTMLLALAGGHVWIAPGKRLPIVPVEGIARLALLAPATAFFLAPGALDAVKAPILAWVSTNDVVTPPEQADFLKRTLGARVPVEVRPVQDAGHFSFMNTPPPGSIEPLANREEFLERLMDEVCAFVRQPA